MNTKLFLNIDVSSKHNDNKSEHQVIHVETHPDSFYVIGACFSIVGEQKLQDERKYYEEITLTSLVLRNLGGVNKKIKNAFLSDDANFDYHFVIELEDNTMNESESKINPNLMFKRVVTNSSFDLTINDDNMVSLSDEEKARVGPKICQFRSA